MESINFADNNVFLLEDPEKILHQLSFYRTGSRRIETLEDLKVLEQPHLVCIPEEQDYYLFLTIVRGRLYSVFVQGDHCYYTKLRFDEELYGDTVFQGSFVVNQKGKWVFQIADILALKGQQMNSTPLTQRLLTVQNILNQQYKWDEYMNVCHIELKPYFTYDCLEGLETDALWFVPEHMFDAVYSVNFTEDSKEVTEIQGDKELWLRNTWKPDLYEVYEQEDQILGYAYIQSLSDSKKIRGMVQKDPVKMKCRWNERFSKWQPILA